MKQLNSVLLILLLANMSIIAEGKQDNPTLERTPIRNSSATEETLAGILIVENNILFLAEENGATYAINPQKPSKRDQPPGGGPPPGGRKGERPEGDRPAHPEMGRDFEEFNGLEVEIHGMIMGAPPVESPFENIDGIIFPDSIIVNGEEIL